MARLRTHGGHEPEKVAPREQCRWVVRQGRRPSRVRRRHAVRAVAFRSPGNQRDLAMLVTLSLALFGGFPVDSDNENRTGRAVDEVIRNASKHGPVGPAVVDSRDQEIGTVQL